MPFPLHRPNEWLCHVRSWLGPKDRMQTVPFPLDRPNEITRWGKTQRGEMISHVTGGERYLMSPVQVTAGVRDVMEVCTRGVRFCPTSRKQIPTQFASVPDPGYRSRVSRVCGCHTTVPYHVCIMSVSVSCLYLYVGHRAVCTLICTVR